MNAPSDYIAASYQAVDILRRRADRPDIPLMTWMAPSLYTHLVINDYLGQRLPEPMVVCPEDRNRKLWQTSPRGFDAGEFNPAVPTAPAPPSPDAKRWPYSSSYVPTASAWDASNVGNRVYQGTAHSNYFVPGGAKFGGLKIASVQNPSSKVHLYDYNERHFGGKQPFWGLEQCRQPLSFFDGSVRMKQTREANRGWQPNAPTSAAATPVTYTPQGHEPPTVSGLATDTGWAYYRFTRGGLAGVDFGGREIRTGQPAPTGP